MGKHYAYHSIYFLQTHYFPLFSIVKSYQFVSGSKRFACFDDEKNIKYTIIIQHHSLHPLRFLSNLEEYITLKSKL